MQRENRLPADVSRQFRQALEAVAGKPAIPEWYLNLPREPQCISEAERIQGLATIWAEARTSFAYWHSVPDLDWDAEFRRFLPLVAAAEDPAEYYRVLRRFMALLHEGHSYVIQPPWIQNRVRPGIGIALVEGQPVVSRGTGLPLGSVITHVEGRPVDELLPVLMEAVGGSTEQNRTMQAVGALLEGPQGTAVEVGAHLPDGTRVRAALVRDGSLPAPALLEREDLPGGVAVVRIGAFHPDRVVELFHSAFPDFAGVNALVIDLRRNNGGNSAFGDAILARLIDSPVERMVSYRPLYSGEMAGMGLGRPVLTEPEPVLQPDQTRPRYTGPVALLIGCQTVSAGEDFAACFRLSGRGPIIGQPSAGSTGTPAIFRLPGGGVGAVSATLCVYPGSADFAGKGLQPDRLVEPTIAGVAAGRDEVLEAAIACLQVG